MAATCQSLESLTHSSSYNLRSLAWIGRKNLLDVKDEILSTCAEVGVWSSIGAELSSNNCVLGMVTQAFAQSQTLCPASLSLFVKEMNMAATSQSSVSKVRIDIKWPVFLSGVMLQFHF